jgi:hypothetical protein
MAAFDKALWSIGNYQTFLAQGALSVGQMVTLGSAGRQVAPTDATSEVPVGIVYDNAADGAECVVITTAPVVPCIAGGIVTRGAYVMPQVGGGLEGRVVDTVFSPIAATANVGIVGLALDSATNGQHVRVLLCGSALLGAR